MAIVPYISGMEFGRGYDPIKGECVAQALKSDGLKSQYGTGQMVTYKLKVIETVQELCDVLDLETSLSISGFGAKLSAEASIAQSVRRKMNEIFLLVIVQVTNPARKLNEFILEDNAREMIKNGETENYNKFFSTHYISGLISGGSLFGTVTIREDDAIVRKELADKLSFTGYGAGGEAEIKKALEVYLKGKSISVDIKFRGGSGVVIPAMNLENLIDLSCHWPDIVKSDPVPVYALTDEYDRTIPETSMISIAPIIKQAISSNLSFYSKKYVDYQERRNTLDYYLTGDGSKALWLFENKERAELMESINSEMTGLDIVMKETLDYLQEQHSTILPVDPPRIYQFQVNMSFLIAQREAEKAALDAAQDQVDKKLNIENRITALEKLENNLAIGLKSIEDGSFSVPNAVYAVTAGCSNQANDVPAANTAIQKVADDVVGLKDALSNGTFRVLNAQNANFAVKAANSDNSIKALQADNADWSDKARMLLARNENHFMRCRRVTSENTDRFELYRIDGEWFPLIEVSYAREGKP